MVAAYHLIWTAYGHWLPNDPRGSTSQEIRCAQIAPLGELHFGRKRVQPAGSTIREFYDAARGILKHELLSFNENQVELISQSFHEVIKSREYTCYACAIMPDHVHVLIRKHRDKAEEIISHLQGASRLAIQNEYSLHPVWGGPGWKVFLNTQDDIRRTIRYVENNPLKFRRPRQRWLFVREYDGWLPGQVKIAKPQAEK